MNDDASANQQTDIAAGPPPGTPTPLAYCPKCGEVMASADPACPHCGYDFPLRDPTPPGYRFSWFADCVLMVASVIAGLASLFCLIASVMLIGQGRFSEAIAATIGTVLLLAHVIVFTRVQHLEPPP